MHSHDRTLLARLGFADPDKRLQEHDLACQYLAQNEVASSLLAPQIQAEIKRMQKVGKERRGSRPVVVEWTEKVRPQLEVPLSKGEDKYKTTVGFVDLTLAFTVVARVPPEYEFEWLERYADILSTLESSGIVFEVVEIPEKDRRPQSETSYVAWRFASGRRALTPQEKVYLYDLHGSDTSTLQNYDLGRLIIAKTQPLSPCYEYSTVGVEVKITPVGVGEILRQIKLYQEYADHRHWYVVTAFPLSEGDIDALKTNGVLHAKLGSGFLNFVKARVNAPVAPPAQTREV